MLGLMQLLTGGGHNMPESKVAPLLQQFKESIEAGQTSDIRNALSRINKKYYEIEQKETVQMRQAVEARTSVDPTTSKWEKLNRYIHNQTVIEFERGIFLNAAAQYVENPSSRSSSELLKSIKEIQKHEQRIVDQRSATDEIIESTTLPPSAEIVTVSKPDLRISKEDTFEVKVTVQNVGDRPASNVRLTAESKLTLTPTKARLETLSSDQRISTTFEGKATKPGTKQVTVRLSSNNAGEDKKTITFPVQGEKPVESSQDLIAHWRFEQNLADSVGSYDLSPIESSPDPTYTKEAPQGQYAVNLSDIHLSHENFYSLDRSEPWSIGFWMRDSDSMSGWDDDYIIQYSPQGGGWGISTTTDGLPFLYTSGSNTKGKGTTSVLDGNWHHICFVHDQPNEQITLYIDGEKEYSIAHTDPTKGESSPTLHVGNMYEGYKDYNGQLDDLRIYTRLLSSDEVKSISNLNSDTK